MQKSPPIEIVWKERDLREDKAVWYGKGGIREKVVCMKSARVLREWVVHCYAELGIVTSIGLLKMLINQRLKFSKFAF
jgi:hypothetical protein